MNNLSDSDKQKEFMEFIKNDDYSLNMFLNKIDPVQRKQNILKESLLWIRSLIFVFIAVLLIRGFIGEPVEVFGPSMQNTFVTGDVLIMSKISKNLKGVKKGDVVVIEIEPVKFKYLTFFNDITWFRRLFPMKGREDYIKRVIAIQGDVIEFKDGYVYVNDEKLDEPYVKKQGVTLGKNADSTYTVPKGHIYVLGDNRTLSKDSRSIGPLSVDAVIGKIVFRTWPLTKFGRIK